MAGRTPIEPSYIVDLFDIMEQIIDEREYYKKKYEIVIPVYQNNFRRSVAERLIFLSDDNIYQSVDSSFVDDISIVNADSVFCFKDKFESGNECGYKFGSIDLAHPDEESITLSYYWR